MKNIETKNSRGKVLGFQSASEKKADLFEKGLYRETIEAAPLGSNRFLHLGLHQDDLLYYDTAIKPRHGDLILFTCADDATGVDLAVYCEDRHEMESVLGTVIGFRRVFWNWGGGDNTEGV